MKLRNSTKLRVLKKLESSPDFSELYEVYDHDPGGYERRRSPDWTEEEVYHIEQMIDEGLLRRNEVRDSPELGWEDGPHAKSYIRPTHNGHKFVEDSLAIKRWGRNIAQNVPTIITSVMSAIAIAYAMKILGFDNH